MGFCYLSSVGDSSRKGVGGGVDGRWESKLLLYCNEVIILTLRVLFNLLLIQYIRSSWLIYMNKGMVVNECVWKLDS